MNPLATIKFDNQGLIPAIAQDYKSGEVLMFAFMNNKALELTIKSKEAVYFSRSRNKLWLKGEESGHKQIVKDIFTDCDKDVILLKIQQVGNIACHTGRTSCFFNKLVDKKWEQSGKIIKNPTEIYK